MNRTKNLKRLKNHKKKWDIIIIGGGASGLGAAIDAASRGYKTLLLEKYDFAKGTSSRSTKLVHGGVRYLQNGDISLVIEALKERGIMRNNAPHLVRDLSFVIPSYDWWNSPFYGLGLKIYDLMAGKLGLGPSTILDHKETIALIPNVKQEDLRGGVIYHDGQFDDARMAVSMAQTAENHGATLLNYVGVTGLEKQNDLITGLTATDTLTNTDYQLKARVVINATGIFSDQILQLDQPESPAMIRPSQGVHLVLEKKFLKGPHAIMIPQTSDGRVLFAVPWHQHVVVGTTDTPIDTATAEPIPLEEEIDFILANAAAYMTQKPKRSDVKSVFAGLRPLAAQGDKNETKEVSRHHKVMVSTAGLVSVIGGKWTTYRKMAEDTIDTAIPVGGLPERKCNTERMPIHGYDFNSDWDNPLHVYGSDIEKIIALNPNGNTSLATTFHITENQIQWAVEQEMAVTLEDVLARRVRGLFLDAKESLRIAPTVARLMAKFMNTNQQWETEQLKSFESLAQNYIL
jgi:glycerol-3-phosphate dehydrogenase